MSLADWVFQDWAANRTRLGFTANLGVVPLGAISTTGITTLGAFSEAPL